MKKVTTFWNWFQDNEKLIYNAIKTGNNKQLIWLHLIRNYTYLSPDIILLMQTSITQQHKITFIFSAKGNKEQFPILIALEEQAPKLKYFVPQAFIKPMQYKTSNKNGNDLPYTFGQYQLKISSIYLSLINYNSNTKQLKIRLYIPNYNNLKKFSCLEKSIEILLCIILGEIDFRNHIEEMECTQLETTIPGLLNLIELPEYIDYLFI